eukprot:gene2754-3750_t
MSSVKKVTHYTDSDSESKTHKDPEIGWLIALLTYCSYALIISIGHFRDLCANITGRTRYTKGSNKKGYANLFQSWESFYTRRLYHRISDCWNRPICSSPMAYVNVMERESKSHDGVMVTTGKSLKCLNLGSYNYLGFADDWKDTCRRDVLAAVDQWPNSACSSRLDVGSNTIHEELERTVAEFVGKECAIVYAM